MFLLKTELLSITEEIFESIDLDLDIGVMDQYWREVKEPNCTNSINLMVDIIISNPFRRKKAEKTTLLVGLNIFYIPLTSNNLHINFYLSTLPH
jgi:hypothetical protein